MKQSYSWSPLLCAALGAAGAYYAFAPLFMIRYGIGAVLAAFAVLVSLCALSWSSITVSKNRYEERKFALLTVFFTAGFVLGLASYSSALRDGNIRLGLLPEEVHAVSGVLFDDPRISASGKNIGVLQLAQTKNPRGVKAQARGRVLVLFPEGTMPRLKTFGRGSTLYLDGRFITSGGETNTKLFRATSVHISKPPSYGDKMRTQLRLAMVSFFSGTEWGALALALLIGIRDNLESDFTAGYVKSGSAYILALSGMHLAIISSIIAFLLRKPLGLKAAAATGAIFIIFYIYLVGPQSSLVRAGIAYLIGAAAILVPLRTNALHILGLSFLIQLLIDPASGSTISFILSYLALAGLLLAGKPVSALLRGRLPDGIVQPVALSLGAFLATMPVCAVFFGELRPIGILIGLVAVPLTTVFMIGAIICLIASAALPVLTVLLGKILSLIYTALEIVTHLGARVPAIPMFNTRMVVLVCSIIPFIIIYLCEIRLKAKIRVEPCDQL